jgi:outer membrane protein assembly factor BamB
MAVDARSGRILWRTPPMPDRNEPSAPVIFEGRAYTIHESGLAGFNLKTGQQEFLFPGNFPSSNNPIHFQIAGGRAYFTANFEQPKSAGNRRGFLYALDLASKQIVLRHRVNREKKYVDTWPTTHFLVDGEFIYYENESLLVKLRQ